MALYESPVATVTCIFLEQCGGFGGDDGIDMSKYDDHMLHTGGNYICGKTTRINGPDSRPADALSCRRGRQCFKSREGF
ncbi:MAG: hypothetical protein K1X53_00230 [Candidatus Sumerlaeaceae bacterium]|nr:hypothetical protein [Candidatus Sumerlaeaceae bacterium]